MASFKHLSPMEIPVTISGVCVDTPPFPIDELKGEMSKMSAGLAETVEVIAERLGQLTEAVQKLEPTVVVQPAVPGIAVAPARPAVTVEARPGEVAVDVDLVAKLKVPMTVTVLLCLLILLQAMGVACFAYQTFQGGN